MTWLSSYSSITVPYLRCRNLFGTTDHRRERDQEPHVLETQGSKTARAADEAKENHDSGACSRCVEAVLLVEPLCDLPLLPHHRTSVHLPHPTRVSLQETYAHVVPRLLFCSRSNRS